MNGGNPGSTIADTLLMLCYEPDHWVLLFPTKEHWRNPSRIEYIEAGLAKFRRTYAEKGITSAAFPRLGCGNGELDWTDVQPVMEKYLKDLPIDIYIYLGTGPDSVPEHKIQEKTVDWLRQNAKDMSFQGVEDDIRYNCSIVPYSFFSGGQKWNVHWQDGLFFEQPGWEEDPVSVAEDDFYEKGQNFDLMGSLSEGRKKLRNGSYLIFCFHWDMFPESVFWMEETVRRQMVTRFILGKAGYMP